MTALGIILIIQSGTIRLTYQRISPICQKTLRTLRFLRLS
jgi:hypothetical protein